MTTLSISPLVQTKKRVLTLSILDASIQNILALLLTPREGDKKLRIWLVMHAKQSRRRVYHSLLFGELMCTQIHLAPYSNLTIANIQQQCWNQLQAYLFQQIGQNSKALTSKSQEEVEWIEKWQSLKKSNYICHILAIMEIRSNDKRFFFDEAKFKWIDEAFLQVLVN